MHVLLLNAASQNDALRLATDELAKALALHGCKVSLYDLRRLPPPPDFAESLKRTRAVDLVVTFFTAFGDYERLGGVAVNDVVKAPCVFLLNDYPLLHQQKLARMATSCILLTTDRSHAMAIKSVFGAERFAYVGFQPSAALGEAAPLPEDAEAFAAARPIAVLFSGNYARPGDVPWKDYPEDIRKVFGDAADIALGADWISPLDALQKAMAANGMTGDNPDIPPEDLRTMAILSRLVNEWVYTARRQRFFLAAARVGLPLTVCGAGFEADVARYPNIDYRGIGDTAETLRLMRKARLTVSLNANCGEGTTPHVFSAMLGGSAVATETSTYYAEHFSDGVDIAMFRWSTLDDDLSRFLTLSQAPEALFAMAKAGQQKVVAQYRMGNLVDGILAAAREVAAVELA